MKLETYSKKFMHYHADSLPELLEGIFKKRPPQKMADLGSGDGSILFALSSLGYLNKVKEIIAIDISADRIENIHDIDTRIQCHVADVSNLSMIKEASLDLAISSQVIEHLPDDEIFIKEAHTVLKKDGLFFLSTVFKKWYGWYFYRCNGKWVLDPTHVREYTQTSALENLVLKHGFEILKSKKALFWFPITDFILKRIGMKRTIYANPFMKLLRKIKIPILGYYNWEMVLVKKK